MESKEKMVSGKKLRASVLMPESVDMVESAVKRTQVSVVWFSKYPTAHVQWLPLYLMLFDDGHDILLSSCARFSLSL